VVQRTIRADWHVIRARLTDRSLLRVVPMQFDEHFERVDRVVEIWRANGRVERHGRLERIEIEVSQSSSFSAELRVLPWKQRRYHFSNRRQDWFVEIANQLEEVLTAHEIELRDLVDLVEPAAEPLTTQTELPTA
jgi:hypothetical protein